MLTSSCSSSSSSPSSGRVRGTSSSALEQMDKERDCAPLHEDDDQPTRGSSNSNNNAEQKGGTEEGAEEEEECQERHSAIFFISDGEVRALCCSSVALLDGPGLLASGPAFSWDHPPFRTPKPTARPCSKNCSALCMKNGSSVCINKCNARFRDSHPSAVPVRGAVSRGVARRVASAAQSVLSAYALATRRPALT